MKIYELTFDYYENHQLKTDTIRVDAGHVFEARSTAEKRLKLRGIKNLSFHKGKKIISA